MIRLEGNPPPTTGEPIADAIIVVAIIAAFCFFGWLFLRD